jgi:hypothetical protein
MNLNLSVKDMRYNTELINVRVGELMSNNSQDLYLIIKKKMIKTVLLMSAHHPITYHRMEIFFLLPPLVLLYVRGISSRISRTYRSKNS